jgi:hypothetical protein
MCSRHGCNEFWSENLTTRGRCRKYGIDKGLVFFLMNFATLQQETTRGYGIDKRVVLHCSFLHYDVLNLGNSNKNTVLQFIYYLCYLAPTCFGIVAILR